MGKRDLMALAEEERSELLGLLRTLTVTQWDAPSLCSRWRVRDVAIHVVSYDELSVSRLAATFLRGGLRVSVVNDVALKRYGALAGGHSRPCGQEPAPSRTDVGSRWRHRLDRWHYPPPGHPTCSRPATSRSCQQAPGGARLCTRRPDLARQKERQGPESHRDRHRLEHR